MKTIYGIIQPYSPGYTKDVQGMAIDGETGEIIVEHISTNENWAMKDLGFVSGEDIHRKNERYYKPKYPEGYTLIWIGEWFDNQTIINLSEKYKSLVK